MTGKASNGQIVFSANSVYELPESKLNRPRPHTEAASVGFEKAPATVDGQKNAKFGLW
jgi:hypothetical protein